MILDLEISKDLSIYLYIYKGPSSVFLYKDIWIYKDRFGGFQFFGSVGLRRISFCL
jgi:hypothetical protein